MISPLKTMGTYLLQNLTLLGVLGCFNCYLLAKNPFHLECKHQRYLQAFRDPNKSAIQHDSCAYSALSMKSRQMIDGFCLSDYIIDYVREI